MAQDANYTVKPGDMLSISVWKEPDLQKETLVRPDGGFSFPLVGEVDAKGNSRLGPGKPNVAVVTAVDRPAVLRRFLTPLTAGPAGRPRLKTTNPGKPARP